MKNLNLYPQNYSGNECFIIGTREGLTELRNALDFLLDEVIEHPTSGIVVNFLDKEDIEFEMCIFIQTKEELQSKLQPYDYSDDISYQLEQSYKESVYNFYCGEERF